MEVHRTPDGTAWVGASFDHPTTKMVESDEVDPHGHRYRQRWPATPYSVRVRNLRYPNVVYAKVHVDGRFAASVYVNRGQTVNVAGFQANVGRVSYTLDAVTEFLFTLPRAGPPDPAAPKVNPAHLGTIRVEFVDTEKTGTRRVVNDRPVHRNDATEVRSVKKNAAKNAKATTATASGARVQQADHRREYVATVFRLLDEIETTTVRYATKSQLEFRGIIESADAREAREARENGNGDGGGGVGGGGDKGDEGGGRRVKREEGEKNGDSNNGGAKRVKREPRADAAKDAGVVEIDDDDDADDAVIVLD